MQIGNTERRTLELVVHRLYRATLAPFLTKEITQQRVKLFWFGWGYWPLLRLPTLSLWNKVTMLARFLRIDWRVLHGHTPYQVAMVGQTLAERLAEPGEVMVEAGCWEGGSSAKWSILCHHLGYGLLIYDSFEGVESAASPEGEYDYSGEYAAQEALVWAHLKQYGEPSVCRTIKGWFCHTMPAGSIVEPVRIAYIDCDTAKGTHEALTGILPAMPNGFVFSQDCHIPSVVKWLTNPATWKAFGRPLPAMTRLDYRLVRCTIV